MTGHATTIGRPDEASSDPYPVQDGDTIAGPSPTMPTIKSVQRAVQLSARRLGASSVGNPPRSLSQCGAEENDDRHGIYERRVRSSVGATTSALSWRRGQKRPDRRRWPAVSELTRKDFAP
ncbi:hypothetical protein PI124_g15591 [Phytophthora idaei]|nr:hypothetical protein PI124_g15591 [Phytophthora idaei]